jgi:hypothetical protein
MTRYTVFFKQFSPHSVEFKTGNDHVIGKLRFLLYIDGGFKGEFDSNVKQSVGGEFEDIEVCLPNEYDGPLDYLGFSQAAKEYVLGLVGPQARLLRFADGATNIKIQGSGSLGDEPKYTWLFDPLEGTRKPVQLPDRSKASSANG